MSCHSVSPSIISLLVLSNVRKTTLRIQVIGTRRQRRPTDDRIATPFLTKDTPSTVLQVRPRPTSKTLCHCFKNHEGRRSRFGIKIGDIDEYIERISEKDSQVSRT